MKQFIINMALGYLSAFLQAFGLPQLNQFGPIVAKAFGPEGCRHFSELNTDEQRAVIKRAPSTMKKHDDWPKPLRWVPRSLTTFVMPNDEPPAIIDGTSTNEDIPEPGTYVVTKGYFAWTSPSGLHARFGFRWDQNDKVLEFPSFTVKQLG